MLLLLPCSFFSCFFFFFNEPATTEIYTLSLHDALPIYHTRATTPAANFARLRHGPCGRSEEHTSELQSLRHLVCRLLLEKKKNKDKSKTKKDTTQEYTGRNVLTGTSHKKITYLSPE